MEQTVAVPADVRQWGNSVGVVIPAALAKANGIKPGMRVRIIIEFERERNDASRLPTWDLGGKYDIRKLADEETGRAGTDR